MTPPKLHVVVLPYPAQGHLPPLIHLSHKIAACGIAVTIVNIHSIHEQLLKRWTSSPELDVRLAGVRFTLDLPTGFTVSSLQSRAEFASHVNNMQGPFEELLEQLETPASCIIADDLIQWAKLTAKRLEIPSVSYFPGAASWSSIHHHIDLILSQGDLPLQDSKKEIVTYIPGLSPICPRDLPEYFHHTPRERLQVWSQSPGQMRDATWVLVNSFYDLEPEAFGAMTKALGERYVPVGPLFPVSCEVDQTNTSLRAEDERCIKWLDDKRPSSVLYVSFGSCSSLSKVEFEELVYGLEASKQPFLWVVRPDMFLPGEGAIFDEFVERSQKQGVCVSWAPQLKVLSHRSVGGFLTHCGWNSTLESIANGVPMLGWPQHSDQDLNCKLIEKDFKVGFRLVHRDEVPSRKNIEQGIREFMNQETTKDIRMQVRKLANGAKTAASPGGSSFSSIQALVEFLERQRRSRSTCKEKTAKTHDTALGVHG